MPKLKDYAFERMLRENPEAAFKYNEVKERYGLKMDIIQIADYLGLSVASAWRWVAEVKVANIKAVTKRKRHWWTCDVVNHDLNMQGWAH